MCGFVCRWVSVLLHLPYAPLTSLAPLSCVCSVPWSCTVWLKLREERYQAVFCARTHSGWAIVKTAFWIFKRTKVFVSDAILLGWASGLGRTHVPILRYSASPASNFLHFTLSSRKGAHTLNIYMKKGVAVGSLVFYRHSCVISFT